MTRVPMMELVHWSSLLLGECNWSLMGINCSVLIMLFSCKFVWVKGWRVLMVVVGRQWDNTFRKYQSLRSSCLEIVVTNVMLCMVLGKFTPLWKLIRINWPRWSRHWIVSVHSMLTTKESRCVNVHWIGE